MLSQVLWRQRAWLVGMFHSYYLPWGDRAARYDGVRSELSRRTAI